MQDADQAQHERVGGPSTGYAAAEDATGEQPDSNTAVTEPMQPPGATDSADGNAVHAADTSDASAQEGKSLSLSAEVNPSEVNGVDVTNTFEYPTDGKQHTENTAQPPSDDHGQRQAAGASDSAPSDEIEDELAPLPTSHQSAPLTVDPSAASFTNAIAPPTPTVITPPASSHIHGYPAIPSAVASATASSVASPTAAAAAVGGTESAIISDPFADPFAEEVGTVSPARPVAAKPAVVLKANAALPSNPLFADDDDDDDLLFASSAPKPKPAAAASKPASKRASFVWR